MSLYGGERRARIEVAPGAVGPLAFGAPYVARAVALGDVDGGLLGAAALVADRDHPAATRLDRVLDRGRAALAAAHARHRAGEGAEVGAEPGAQRNHHQPEIPR